MQIPIFSGIVPDRVMPWYFLASNGKDTYACGVQTGTSALCFWQSDQQGIRLVRDVRCGGQDVILGERVSSAARVVERFSQPGENPFAPHAPSRICFAPIPTNRPYSVVDAGRQWGGLAYGAPWQLGYERFPDMPGMAREIKAAGEFGFYLDPSVPEMLDRVSQDVARFREWGYELIKHDYTTFDRLGRWGMHMGAAITNPGWRFAERSLTTAEVIRNLYTRIHEAADEMVIIACHTIGHLAAGKRGLFTRVVFVTSWD